VTEDRARHEIVRTRAGALAVRCREAGEIMHPGVGPLVEAEQLYVRQSDLAGRLRAQAEPLVLFDVGLGAGSNAIAARAVSEAAPASAAQLELISFERDLGALELALGQGVAFGFAEEMATAARTLLASGRHDSARTSWRLEPGDLLEALARQTALADVIFWDPFSPRANPTLWTVAAFAAARRCAGPACTLFTYSASTATRVAMLLAGWAVGVGDGVGTKDRTTAAAVRAADLARPLDRRWLGRLDLPGVPLPADAPSDAVARVAAAAQFQAI
jgi:queuine tRNA-ribosyltransferase